MFKCDCVSVSVSLLCLLFVLLFVVLLWRIEVSGDEIFLPSVNVMSLLFAAVRVENVIIPTQ